MNEINENPWSDEIVKAVKSESAPPKVPKVKTKFQEEETEYDIDGLMTDFPTAKELERFIFDETGMVLNLKGRANKLKYQIAMDVLNGKDIDSKYIGDENPYVDKNDLVPVEDLKPIPQRDSTLPDRDQVQNSFYTPFVPHPIPEFRSRGKKAMCIFRKYKTGEISYEVLGPLSKVPHGNKIDKYGRSRPEIIKWVDPRTGEQTVMRSDGTLTPIGRRLRSMMQALKVNKSNQWDVWVDREFGSINRDAISNPWDLK